MNEMRDLGYNEIHNWEFLIRNGAYFFAPTSPLSYGVEYKTLGMYYSTMNT